ncbi:MAG: Tm-1-like ATP-binding domain-containing protein [Gemmatimonadetes bacterium]|nr:Tm-1-like ATP-binding domain-containing protein [Gemmatimonadota bacterium]
MSRTVVILATLDTKSEEAECLRQQVVLLGGSAVIMDLGVVGMPGLAADYSREAVAKAGGGELAALLKAPTRESAGPVMVAGATKIVLDLISTGRAHAVVGVGGTQGTSSCTQVMQALPYGFPKVMVSTAASGDTSRFVGVKDITMMFSVSDLVGVNPFTARILANAAAAAYGMSLVGGTVDTGRSGKPLVAMTNLGVLTDGATLAQKLFRDAGYDVVVFHAVGSGGRAMEQLMKEGVIGAVFDYALGEIADDVFGGLRAGGPERLTVAGKLGIPQVICPGGAEHLGIFVEPNVVPDKYRDHQHVFHSPVVFVPRLNREEIVRVAEDICRRLQSTRGKAVFMLPLRGVGRYSIPGGPLHDPESDAAFFAALRAGLPTSVEVVEVDAEAEAPAFVAAAVRRMLELVEAG